MSLNEGLIRNGPAPEEINNLFSSISKTYDLANDLITFGIARRWRRALVNWSVSGISASGLHNELAAHEDSVTRVLDCATGTGDLAFEFARTLALTRSNVEVTGCDFCEPMLKIANEKIDHDKCLQKNSRQKPLQIKFERADVTALQYPSSYFDISSIAYGIRNVKDVGQALAEMARVTRPGGYVMILETGVVENRFLRTFVQLHFQVVVPFLGGIVSGRRAAYKYLQKSSSQFPSGAAFCDVLRSTSCFSTVEYRAFLGGASYIYRACVR